MFDTVRRWLNPLPQDDAATVQAKLHTRCNAEIVARLLRRAEIHEQQGGYPARCSPLDREAAQRIIQLERSLALAQGASASNVQDQVDRMLNILRS